MNLNQFLLYLANKINKEMKIELYNQLGQIVLSKKITKAQQTEHLEVSHLSKGVYNLKLQQANNTVDVKKIHIVN